MQRTDLIEILDEKPIIISSWGGDDFEDPLSRTDDEIIAEADKFIDFLRKEDIRLVDVGTKINIHPFDLDVDTLDDTIDDINKIVSYLNDINITWNSFDFLFKFINHHGNGIVYFDNETNLATVVYSDEAKNGLQIKQYQLGYQSKIL